MNIKIYYRHINSETNSNLRPEWFSYEKAFNTLLNSIIESRYNLNIELIISYDDSGGAIETNFISQYLENSNVNITSFIFTGGSQKKALQKTFELAKKNLNMSETKNDIYLFMENDYIYTIKWVEELVELFNSGVSFDYFSLYDHPDKYANLKIHDVNKNLNIKSNIFSLKNRYWRTVPGTCASFGMKSEVLKRDYKYLKFFGAFGIVNDYLFFKIMTKFLRRILITPIPGLATHAMKEFISPVNDWGGIASNQLSNNE